MHGINSEMDSFQMCSHKVCWSIKPVHTRLVYRRWGEGGGWGEMINNNNHHNNNDVIIILLYCVKFLNIQWLLTV